MPKEIVLVPFEEIRSNVLDFLKKNLEQIFNRPVSIANALPLPPSAFNVQRKQYLSYPFLDSLRLKGHPQTFTLGIIKVDLYVPGLNFIFGQAALGKGVAVISLARLHPSFYGQKEDEKVFLIRALKEAVHELGHLYGLNHCPNSHCVMHFSNSIWDTDKKGIYFCNQCQTKIK